MNPPAADSAIQAGRQTAFFLSFILFFPSCTCTHSPPRYSTPPPPTPHRCPYTPARSPPASSGPCYQWPAEALCLLRRLVSPRGGTALDLLGRSPLSAADSRVAMAPVYPHSSSTTTRSCSQSRRIQYQLALTWLSHDFYRQPSNRSGGIQRKKHHESIQ